MLESAAMFRADRLCRLAGALAITAAVACRAERPAVPAAGETRHASPTAQAASPGMAPPPDIAAPYAYHPNLSVERNVAVPMLPTVKFEADWLLLT